MKRLAFGLGLVVVVLATSAASAQMVTGNSNPRSYVYHRPSCAFVGRIRPDRLEYFDDYRKAQDAGYRPCRKCKPPPL